jgi:hypothetical protein
MTVRLWNVADGKLVQTLRGHTSSILKVAFSPDGRTLASSSVDETVRLWQTSDGNGIRVLTGYTDFIYALAFSPDGKTLASGGGDNAIRLWNLDALGPPSGAAVGPVGDPMDIQSTTPDCRQCHHRQGQARPARVIELNCEACHSGGIGQSFCAAFPRSANVGPLPVAYHSVNEVSGLPLTSDRIAVVIASPGNGETLYVRGDFMAPERISGSVSYADPASIKKVEIHLDILSNGQKTASLATHPTGDGTFTFDVAINAGSPTPQLTRPGTKICLVCHGDFQPKAGLPVGSVKLVVTATTPDGGVALDERWIRVDSSREAAVPVQVNDSRTGKPIPNLSIEASTIIYQWRDRFGTVTSGTDGNAQLHLEAASQSATTYKVSVPPQVVNGILYASQPVQVTLEPGTASHAGVTLMASAQSGHLEGQLNDGEPQAASESGKVWAIQLPAGPAFQTTVTHQNTFAFDPIPVGAYLLTPDLLDLAGHGLAASPQQVDLMQSPHARIAIPLAPARPLIGNVVDSSGHPVAFAWIQINGKGAAQALDPASGEFLLSSVPDDLSFVTVNAPGFYSQSQHVSSVEKTLSFHLVAVPETQQAAWGQGQVTVPLQTHATVSGSNIRLDRGWLWGQGGTPQPLSIDIDSMEVIVSSGDFALEHAPGQTGWLYLRQGTAEVHFSGNQSPVDLRSGQMIALLPSAVPLAMAETLALSLHPPLAESPIPELLEPSPAARLQNWLERAGIGTAQTITFITYFLSLVALSATPFLVLFYISRKRKASASQEKR